MTINIVYGWLMAGVALAVLEVHFAGVGLLFAGLGAITAGSAVWFGLIAEDAFVAQWVLFFAAAVFWAVLLWKPIQRFRRPSPGYNNIVGETAYVGKRLTKIDGEVTWSGTIMKAKLAQDAPVEVLESGAPVSIIDVHGATLIVQPQK